MSVPQDSKKKADFLHQKHVLISICTLTLVIIFSSVNIVLFFKYNHPSTIINIRIEDDEDYESGRLSDAILSKLNQTASNINTSKAPFTRVNIMSRDKWFAKPAVEILPRLEFPIPNIVIYHTQTTNCNFHSQCRFNVRFIQIVQMDDQSFWDIGYNFLVGGDGEVYEGRGWKFGGPPTYNQHTNSLGVAFIGTFNRIAPTKKQIAVCKQLIEDGVDFGYISKDYKVLAAKNMNASERFGGGLYNEIKTWEHWSRST